MHYVEERVLFVLKVSPIKSQPYCRKEKFSNTIPNRKDLESDGKTICELFKNFQQIGTMVDASVGNVDPIHPVVILENATILVALIKHHPRTSD